MLRKKKSPAYEDDSIITIRKRLDEELKDEYLSTSMLNAIIDLEQLTGQSKEELLKGYLEKRKHVR